MKYLMIFLIGGCASEDASVAKTFSDQNLILTSYYTDRCFILKECEEENCTQTIHTFAEGDHTMRDERIEWNYNPPDMYSIEYDNERYDFSVLKKNNDCWKINVEGRVGSGEACPCPYELDRPPLEEAFDTANLKKKKEQTFYELLLNKIKSLSF